MLNNLRVAIIGAGRIAELGHLPGFAQAGAQVVALCNRDRENLDRLADQYGVEGRFSDWHELLSAGGFDAVSICTPPHLHSQIAVSSAQQGYHILVEKPMALTLAACDEMIEAARFANVLLMIAHNQRFSTRHIIAKQIMDSGRLGKPYVAYTAFAHGGPENWSPSQKWYFDASLTRLGVMADLGSHKIDLLRWLLNQDVIEISAFDSTFEKATAVDDTAIMALRFSGGTLATVHVSWAYRPGLADDLSISCEKGTLYVPTDATQPVRILESGKNGETIESLYPFASNDVPGWYGVVAAFVDAVTHHKLSPLSGEEGKATMAVVMAAYEATANKMIMQLKPS